MNTPMKLADLGWPRDESTSYICMGTYGSLADLRGGIISFKFYLNIFNIFNNYLEGLGTGPWPRVSLAFSLQCFCS